MALRFHLLPSKRLPKSQSLTHHHSFPSSTSLIPKSKSQISCSDTDSSRIRDFRIRDLELALDLARKVEKLSIEFDQKQEAVDKSNQILVAELCEYLDLGRDEFKRKWGQLDDEGKLGLVKGFVSEWGVDFHPLSARSVKELVDEYCLVNINSFFSPISSPALLFNGLKKMLGFQSNGD